MPRLVSVFRLLLLAAVVGIAREGIALLREPEPNMLGALLLAVALVSFGALAAWAARHPGRGLGFGDWVAAIMARRWHERLRYGVLPIGIVLTGYLMVVAEEPALQPTALLLLWIASGACMIGGAWLVDRRPTFDAVGLAEPWERWELPTLTLLTAAAWIVRVAMVDHVPYAIHGDEGEMGLEGRAVLAGTLRDPFATAWLSHPTLWFFIQAAGLMLFGDDIGGLRTVSTIIGAMTIPACYLFARPRYGAIVALAAATILAAFPVHIHFSRIALNNIVDPLMALLMLSLLFHGWRTGALASFVGAGWLLGSAQQFYFGSRLLVLICVGLLAHQLILNRAVLLQRWRGMLLMVAGAIAGIGPLLRHYIEFPDSLMARVTEMGLFQSGRVSELLAAGVPFHTIMGNQLWRGFGAYFAVPDSSRFYSAESGILAPLAGVLFVCGLGAAIWRWKRPEQFVLVLFVLGTATFGGVLLIDSPQTPRYVLATPALCTLIALGIQQILQIARMALGVPQRAATLLLIAASIWVAGGGLVQYFIDYTPQQRYAGTRDLTAIAAYLRGLPRDTQIRFMGAPFTYYEYGTLRFNAPRVPGSDVLEPLTSVEQVPEIAARDQTIFVALESRIHELELVRTRYPGGRMRTFIDPLDPNVALFGVYEAP
jgi:Dolichyl-phosphate-mannose-protein mannosyltransferase